MLRAVDLMRTDFHAVAPETRLTELDEAFARFGVSGFPVTVGERPVGVVSLSDLVRCLDTQLAFASGVGDFYRDCAESDAGERPLSQAELGAIAGARFVQMRVEEIMSRALISVAPEDSIAAVARALSERCVHRVLVVEDLLLRGILSSTDIVRAVGEKKLVFDEKR